MNRAESGFTLLEVLGAVALLAFVYTTLSTVAIRGLRSEGESQRLLEASLLADWKLSELEMQIAQGIVPEPDEYDESPYTVTLEVEGFAAPAPPPDPEQVGNPALDALFDPEQTPIREITLTVSWTEGVDEHRVVRTTYGIDGAASAALANQLGASAGAQLGPIGNPSGAGIPPTVPSQ